MTDAVDQTLKTWRTTPFAYGEDDCLLSIGAYIASRGGLDVAGEYRGRYSTEMEALAHMAVAGGACALVARTGWPETATPKRGDVVVADLGGEGVGGLCTGDGVVFRTERGVVEVGLRFITLLGAWQCPS